MFAHVKGCKIGMNRAFTRNCSTKALISNSFQSSSSTKPTSFSDATSFTMLMKGAEPKGKDSYICAGFSLNETVPNGEYP